MKTQETKDSCIFCGGRNSHVRKRVFKAKDGTITVAPACDDCAKKRQEQK